MVNRINIIIEAMRIDGIPTNEASPNFVAQYAFRKDYMLNSEEVVAISNTYEYSTPEEYPF